MEYVILPDVGDLSYYFAKCTFFKVKACCRLLLITLTDGKVTTKAIEFKNRFENLGANLIKQVASATNDVAGDGES